jgi:hypothetical protein
LQILEVRDKRKAYPKQEFSKIDLAKTATGKPLFKASDGD